MSGTLKAKEIRTDIYTYDVEEVEKVIIDYENHTLLFDDEDVPAYCLNCMNPRCMFTSDEAVTCTEFRRITGSVDMHVCPGRAISVGEKSIQIEETLCSGCGLCACACPVAAIKIEAGKAKVNAYSGEGELKRLPVTVAGTKEQEGFLTICEEATRQGTVLYEDDDVMKNIQDYVEHLSQEKQNLLVRNILILLGNHATAARKGNVYMRMDGFYRNESRYGVFEVETGSDPLDMARAVLDDIAVLNTRHGISKEKNQPLAVCLNLPNKRTDYWQVVKDIKEITGIKVYTLTIGALFIMLWNHKEVHDFSKFYMDVDHMSIRSALEEIIGRKVRLKVGTYGVLENEK